MDEQILKQVFERDRFAKHVGIELMEASTGRARARLEIGPQHLNAVDVVHGGAIFALADLVFAVASNSHGQVALGINVAVSYLKAAKAGVLIASAEEESVNSRLATYSIRVTDRDGNLIALMQGTVYRKNDKVEDLFQSP